MGLRRVSLVAWTFCAIWLGALLAVTGSVLGAVATVAMPATGSSLALLFVNATGNHEPVDALSRGAPRVLALCGLALLLFIAGIAVAIASGSRTPVAILWALAWTAAIASLVIATAAARHSNA